MKVDCYIEQMDGFEEEPPETRAECNRCRHETESYGTEDVSIRRCLVLMREECPLRENNYYIQDVASL